MGATMQYEVHRAVYRRMGVHGSRTYAIFVQVFDSLTAKVPIRETQVMGGLSLSKAKKEVVKVRAKM